MGKGVVHHTRSRLAASCGCGLTQSAAGGRAQGPTGTSCRCTAEQTPRHDASRSVGEKGTTHDNPIPLVITYHEPPGRHIMWLQSDANRCRSTGHRHQQNSLQIHTPHTDVFRGFVDAEWVNSTADPSTCLGAVTRLLTFCYPPLELLWQLHSVGLQCVVCILLQGAGEGQVGVVQVQVPHKYTCGCSFSDFKRDHLQQMQHPCILMPLLHCPRQAGWPSDVKA